MRLSVTDVCEVWMGATDLFTYNPQYVMVQCLNSYKQRWDSFAPEALRSVRLGASLPGLLKGPML